MSVVGVLPGLTRYPPADRAAAFDEHLGELATAGGEFSARHCAEVDRAEAFPEQMCAALDALGLPASYVPAKHGGALHSYEDLFALLRCVARRDLTVAVAHGKTFLGAAPVWVAGHRAQANELGQQIISGARVSWGLTERDHGADLLAGKVTARRTGGGYVVNGAKWPVNNATRGSHVTLLARTDPSGGARGFSLFLVRKADLAADTYWNLPKARTLGIRGADISGIAFSGARLRESTLIGEPGSGIETVLRTLQLTRTLCAALSIGAGEHALRIATEFAMTRLIGGRPLIDRPAVRDTLARSASVLLAAEAVTIVGSRAIHALTGEMSVISAVAKALVPTLIDGMIGELAELLGARSFLDGVYADGAFGKVQRDHAIISIFDGSTAVNRAGLIGQFPRLARGYAQRWQDAAGLAETARTAAPPQPFDPRGLRLVSAEGCSIVQGLPAAADRVTDDHVADVAAWTQAAAELHEQLAMVRPAARPAAAAYALAAQYELCFAAAACVQLWEAGQLTAADSLSCGATLWPDALSSDALSSDALWSDALWSDALWLRACLAELMGRYRDVGGGTRLGRLASGEPQAATTDRIVDWLTGAVSGGAAISLFPSSVPGRP